MNQEEEKPNSSKFGEEGKAGINQLTLTGTLIAKSVLRYTPAGLPICEFELEHESEQLEASKPRLVKCTVQALALGVAASQVNGLELGSLKNWSGFVALRSHKSKSLRFHVCAVREC
ncbi:restart primosome assembly protein PriB [Limnobacter thiooxidans]|uniref:Replication restart protein PriB n=1 Tax=Limnobacter thiooxidans TaxID=131080 RepID=A0AA86M8F5_9BURK|nr:primosomal replication protein N [Limnobacter sp.]MCZ8015666.1 primosomal replication protein N [Limnobacter sp.]RZS42750.1 restart primosome assembly protein PriB [Limnobacter thiooxidans]BET25814.1 primosomal replication protein N [Limnobacter thiooxidans]